MEGLPEGAGAVTFQVKVAGDCHWYEILNNNFAGFGLVKCFDSTVYKSTLFNYFIKP
jgi:hypothetical protein